MPSVHGLIGTLFAVMLHHAMKCDAVSVLVHLLSGGICSTNVDESVGAVVSTFHLAQTRLTTRQKIVCHGNLTNLGSSKSSCSNDEGSCKGQLGTFPEEDSISSHRFEGGAFRALQV